MTISLAEQLPTTHDSVERPTEALVDDAVRGDPGAWRDLVTRYGHSVTAAARRYRLGPDETADVVQMTWLRLVENITSIRDPASLPGWLRTTAAREALRLCRRATREVAMPIDDAPDRLHEDVADCVVDRMRADQLRRTVVQLPDRERRLLELLLLPEELSYVEIGRRLGMPIGSIGPVRGRALEHLRRLLSAGEVAA